MSDEETSLPAVELLESPADLLQAPDVPAETLEQVESTKQPRRVKVYEMKGDAWSDRGTGFCCGLIKEQEAVFHVTSEEAQDVILLESKIIKDDLYQIQQNTLIVWQEPDGTDVALSFQEEEGCLEIWNFLRHVQRLLNGHDWEGPEDAHLGSRHPEDEISGDELDTTAFEPVSLPEPSLGQLVEVEEKVHTAMISVARRESLAKFILNSNYVPKLVAVLEVAEDMEAVADLHRLCNIIKALILLNDAAIFESILEEDVFMGVAGILEYDPDFPNHKAEHRKYLCDGSKFKEVVAVKDPDIKLKIHQTFRLQYLKDVVLARILDDPTFSILNSLIFFHQVDIIQHFQHNEEFLVALFSLFDAEATGRAVARRSDAVLFIQQFTGIAKTLQAPARAGLYKTFIEHGLFKVLVYSLSPNCPAKVRLAGADIVVAVIDHDPKLIRGFIIQQGQQDQVTLCGTLIQLLITEKDLGVKAQITEAIRLLVDPAAGPPLMVPIDAGASQKPNEVVLRAKRDDPDAEKFLELFYTGGDIKQLMAPILETDFRNLHEPTFEQTALITHLCDLLCFFIRAHTFRAKYFVLSHNISIAIAQIFYTNERHLQLAALRYFRVCIGMKDDFYNRHLIKNNLFTPIVDLLVKCSARDNLLSSSVLEFFETIRRESMKAIIYNLVDNHIEKLQTLRLATIQGILHKYEQYEAPPPEKESSVNDENAKPQAGQWSEQAKNDREQQAYFDQEEATTIVALPNLQSVPAKRPLVDDGYDAEIEATAPSSSEANISQARAPKITSHVVESSRQVLDHSREAEVQDITASIDEKIGEKRRRSSEDDSADFLRTKKSTAVEGKRNSGSPGSLANAVKKKMLFTFGKKDKDRS